MQRIESQYGREPIEVSDTCPTLAIDRRMGSVHVGTPAARVAELIERGVQDSQDARWTRERIDEAIAYAVWALAENLAEYRYVLA